MAIAVPSQTPAWFTKFASHNSKLIPLYNRQEAKECFASPLNLFYGKLHIVKLLYCLPHGRPRCTSFPSPPSPSGDFYFLLKTSLPSAWKTKVILHFFSSFGHFTFYSWLQLIPLLINLWKMQTLVLKKSIFLKIQFVSKNQFFWKI